ncbi:MAG: hypothetical protein NZ872_05755 [Archaeoglobaceae archaeon]|nr:hypothetical protein [Archaeoglobaceae archaeon]MDW8128703.1 hypothetical protein [Archaeoglobaceae archaeon]
MIWSYRAVKNPIARRKWLYFISILIIFVFGYGIYRILMGENAIRVALLLTIFSLFIFLYAIIALGKPRYYFFDEDRIVYKPFKTKLSDINGYKVYEGDLVIRLNKKGIFGVKTLYFERLEDLREVERLLRRKVR